MACLARTAFLSVESNARCGGLHGIAPGFQLAVCELADVQTAQRRQDVRVDCQAGVRQTPSLRAFAFGQVVFHGLRDGVRPGFDAARFFVCHPCKPCPRLILRLLKAEDVVSIRVDRVVSGAERLELATGRRVVRAGDPCSGLRALAITQVLAFGDQMPIRVAAWCELDSTGTIDDARIACGAW